MTRPLRYLLILMLAPIMVLASTTSADAAVIWGETTGSAKVPMDETGIRPAADGECRVRATYGNSLVQGPGIESGAGQLFIKGSVDCDGQWGSVWGVSMPSQESSSTWVKFNGTDLRTGDDCTLAGFTPQGKIPGVDGTQSFTTASMPVGLANTTGCLVGEVCIEAAYQLDWSGWNDPEFDYLGCKPIDLGPIPRGEGGADSSPCTHGTPAMNGLRNIRIDPPPGDTWEGWHGHQMVLAFTGTPATDNSTVSGSQWTIQWYKPNSTGSGVTNSFPGNHIFGTGLVNRLKWSGTNLAISASDPPAVPDLAKHTNASPEEAIGAMVVWGTGTPSVGRTRPNLCQFWYGPKVIQDPNTEEDEPWGAPRETNPPPPNTTEPDLTPEPTTNSDCHFSVSDPSSWLSGGMCAVVGLLGEMWGTLKNILSTLGGLAAQIAGAIAGAISGAISAAFIPDDGALQDAFDDVSGAFDGTAPGQWLDAFSTQSLTATQSGCAGPTIAFETDMADVNLQPFNACGGVMATVASICKLVLSAGLVLGGGMACVRALGSGFGWNPGVGAGGKV